MSDHMSDTVDDAERGYTLTRTYDAPRELVWRAITEPDLFAAWWGADTQMEVTSWDLRPQGEWTGTMTYEGNEIYWAGRFLEIDEPETLAVAFVDSKEIGDVFDVMTYTLTDHGDTTDLVLRQHGGHLTDEQYEGAKQGTATFLEALAAVVAGL